jgi:hypothetical protein
MRNEMRNRLGYRPALSEGPPSPKLAETGEEGVANEEDIRLNVRLSPGVRAALDWIAASRGISAVEAIRRAIGTEKFFTELSKQGAKIFVQVPGEKNLKEVIFSPF